VRIGLNAETAIRYFEFPEEQNQEFLDAESQGRYFLNHIRNHFRYERLARLKAA
jgi:hypothetical protein